MAWCVRPTRPCAGLYAFFTHSQALEDCAMLPDAPVISKSQPRSLTPWELPSLLTPLHRHCRSAKHRKRERPHFPAIVGFVYRNRFAVASQIQRRFSAALRSDRTTRRHLEELESLGYLDVAPGRGVGPLFPKVYYVTGRGVRKLGESLCQQGKPWQPSRIDRRGRDAKEGYAPERIIHEILITEFMLAVWATIEGRPDLELLSMQRRSLARHGAFQVAVGSRRTRLVPDAMFLFQQKGGGMCCCFLELDNGTMNAKQIAAKYTRYAAWSQSAAGEKYLVELYRRHGAKNPRATFRLLVVARSRTGLDDDRRVAELMATANEAPPAIRERLWLTTAAILKQHQEDELPLGADIWLRARDLVRTSISGSTQGQIAKDRRHHLFPLASSAAPMITPLRE